MSLSKDYSVISSYISSNDKVLDLGCSNGHLLEYLKQSRGIEGIGVETDFNKIQQCLQKKLNVYHGDILEALSLYREDFFDVGILSHTIQVIENPNVVINKMFSVSKKIIVSFRNYGYFGNRIQFLFTGKKPINEAFPYQWYDTPNIHPTSVNDFEEFCQMNQIKIVKKTYLRGDWEKKINFFKNFFAGYAIYLLERKK